MSSHVKILLGLVVGALLGTLLNAACSGTAAMPAVEWTASRIAEPAGKMWLSALIMVVIPLILSSLTLGVAGLGDLRRLGRIGGVTLLSFGVLTALSASLGMLLMNLLAPGSGLDPGIKQRLLETYRGQLDAGFGLSSSAFSVDLLVKIVPRNPVRAAADGDMLAVIFFALLLGVALMRIERSKAEPLSRVLESLGHAVAAIIELVMKVAPLGVGCLIFNVTARFGYELLWNLFQYLAVVLLGLVLFETLGYSLILRLVARYDLRRFFAGARGVLLTAFSTSSSAATLPTTLRDTQEQLGVRPEVAGFVLPLGATLNMNGTALYEGATVLFLAQVFGVDLSLGQQVVVMLLSVITAIGVAGIPGGSLPFMMLVLGMVGVPPEGIAIILGVDRLLDMCRTTLNVTGDMVTATVVERFAGQGPAPAVEGAGEAR